MDEGSEEEEEGKGCGEGGWAHGFLVLVVSGRIFCFFFLFGGYVVCRVG